MKEMANFPGKVAMGYEAGNMIGLAIGQAKCPRNGCNDYFIFNPAQLRFPWAANVGKFIKIKRTCSCGCRFTTLHNKKNGCVEEVKINR